MRLPDLEERAGVREGDHASDGGVEVVAVHVAAGHVQVSLKAKMHKSKRLCCLPIKIDPLFRHVLLFSISFDVLPINSHYHILAFQFTVSVPMFTIMPFQITTYFPL